MGPPVDGRCALTLEPSLDEYHAKRDFNSTPEPRGDHQRTRAERQGQPRRFCVQKHLASHLHYDLRLEHEGVLLSWAVPKGPSMDPSVKRLARLVEPHPLEYREFEGIIPDGYGAGVMMLWDEGTWEPEVDDVDAALTRGDLKLTFHGQRLTGSFALVRTRGFGKSADDGRSWLWLKHRDTSATSDDVTTVHTTSVRTNRDLAAILADDDPARWQDERPAMGGEAGRLFKRVVETALALKQER